MYLSQLVAMLHRKDAASQAANHQRTQDAIDASAQLGRESNSKFATGPYALVNIGQSCQAPEQRHAGGS